MQALKLHTLHWRKTDDSWVRLADGSWRTMSDARLTDPDFDLTRSWALPGIAVDPADEDLGSYLRRIGFTEAQLRYTSRSFINATGDHLGAVSARAALADMHDESAGDGDFRILEGYDRLIQVLAKGLDIRLNTIVEAIGWRGEVVLVRTTDGALHEAARAVITLPLGVLQAGDVCFDPPLPPERQAAIDSLRMGPGMKMFYRFDPPITPPHIAAIYADANPPMWWSPSYGRGGDVAQVWTAFTTGDWTRELLAAGEEDALRQGLETLRKELGKPDLQPSATRVMNWSAERFTRGGYSVTPPGQSGARAALAQPLAGRLYWAGEATAREAWTATVHGAYDSGRRAAAEILSQLKKEKE